MPNLQPDASHDFARLLEADDLAYDPALHLKPRQPVVSDDRAGLSRIPQPPGTRGRVCAFTIDSEPACDTVLSVYNTGSMCAVHARETGRDFRGRIRNVGMSLTRWDLHPGDPDADDYGPVTSGDVGEDL